MIRNIRKRSILIHEFVTGGGLADSALPASWALEGSAMRRALAQDFSSLEGVSVVMTVDARLPDEPGPWRGVRVGPNEEVAMFAKFAAECDDTLCVAPETGGVLAARARTIEQVGGRSLGSRPEAIARFGDKFQTTEYLQRLSVETLLSIRVVPRTGLPRDHPYPAVLKPIDGAGSMDTYFVESPDSLPDSALAMQEALLQPFVPGRVMSAAYLVSNEGVPWLVGLAEQDVAILQGRFTYRGGRVPARIREEVHFPASMFETLRGWVGVDFVWNESLGRAIVLEINPRLTTSYVGWREITPDRGFLARNWLQSTDPGEWKRNVSVRFSADGHIEREALDS
jgi:predicted ATP-grasp superfamily ATP-dependent carboligase